MTCHNDPPEDAEKGLGLQGSRKNKGPGRVVLRETRRKGVSTQVNRRERPGERLQRQDPRSPPTRPLWPLAPLLPPMGLSASPRVVPSPSVRLLLSGGQRTTLPPASFWIYSSPQQRGRCPHIGACNPRSSFHWFPRQPPWKHPPDTPRTMPDQLPGHPATPSG